MESPVECEAIYWAGQKGSARLQVTGSMVSRPMFFVIDNHTFMVAFFDHLSFSYPVWT